MKYLRSLIKKLGIVVDIDFYINKNQKWTLLKRDTLDRVPNIGEKVELFIDSEHITYIVVDVEHRPGKSANVLLRTSKSLLKK